MKLFLDVPVTRTKRCPEGFYLLVNGKRIHYKKRSSAILDAQAILDVQRMQIVTVRQYAERSKSKGPQ